MYKVSTKSIKEIYSQEFITKRTREFLLDVIYSKIDKNYVEPETIANSFRFFNALDEKERNLDLFVSYIKYDIDKYFMSYNFNRFMVYIFIPDTNSKKLEKDIIVFDFNTNKRIIFKFDNNNYLDSILYN